MPIQPRPDHHHCLAALDIVRQAYAPDDVGTTSAQAAARTSNLGPSDLRAVAQALEAHGLARVTWRPDGMPERMTLTRPGCTVGRRLVEGGWAVLFPASGGVRTVQWPPVCPAAVGEGDRPDHGHDLDAPTRIMAEAPSHYDACEVEGSGTEVILTPLTRGKIPRKISIGPDRIDVSRGWEVFSPCGCSYGIIVLAAGEFVGIRPWGGLDPEASLSGVAWQLRVN